MEVQGCCWDCHSPSTDIHWPETSTHWSALATNKLNRELWEGVQWRWMQFCYVRWTLTEKSCTNPTSHDTSDNFSVVEVSSPVGSQSWNGSKDTVCTPILRTSGSREVWVPWSRVQGAGRGEPSSTWLREGELGSAWVKGGAGIEAGAGWMFSTPLKARSTQYMHACTINSLLILFYLPLLSMHDLFLHSIAAASSFCCKASLLQSSNRGANQNVRAKLTTEFIVRGVIILQQEVVVLW